MIMIMIMTVIIATQGNCTKGKQGDATKRNGVDRLVWFGVTGYGQKSDFNSGPSSPSLLS